MDSKKQNSEPQKNEQRKNYAKPELTRYGSFTELTRNVNTKGSDGGGQGGSGINHSRN